MSARSLADFLDTESGIGKLSAQASRLGKLQHIFEQAVPASLARQGRVVNLKPGKLVIHARNGAVAAKIRQLAPSIAALLRNEGVDLNEIQVKVQPLPSNASPRVSKPQIRLGTQQKQGLTLLAERLAQDSPLRAALKRLIEQVEDGSS